MPRPDFSHRVEGGPGPSQWPALRPVCPGGLIALAFAGVCRSGLVCSGGWRAQLPRRAVCFGGFLALAGLSPLESPLVDPKAFLFRSGPFVDHLAACALAVCPSGWRPFALGDLLPCQPDSPWSFGGSSGVDLFPWRAFCTPVTFVVNPVDQLTLLARAKKLGAYRRAHAQGGGH